VGRPFFAACCSVRAQKHRLERNRQRLAALVKTKTKTKTRRV
jgi:hypothetical protein